METWLPISFYDGLYWVSDLGRIRNKHGRILKLKKTTGRGVQYDRVGLSIGNKQTHHYVHRLVLSAFYPRPDMSEMTVDHIDGNPNNNKASNLRWLTNADNVRAAAAAKKRIQTVSETDILVDGKLYRLVE